MFQKIKRLLYFSIAGYFAFFAKIRLKKWNPRIVIITGSSGKTTLLHLVESQLGDKARYSHHANSSIGIPFDILGLYRKDLIFSEWPMLFLLTPFKIFSPIPNESIYIVEADCDRSGEGKFLSTLLKPEVTVWVNVSRTHSANFDKKDFKSIDEAIAYEFGYFAENTKSLVVVNADNAMISEQLTRVTSSIKSISIATDLQEYEISLVGTLFKTKRGNFIFPYLLPKETATSILISLELNSYFGIKGDKTFKNFNMPPGRSSFYKGVKNTTIVDSTYNSNLDSVSAVLEMFGQIKSGRKWAVLGDMLEQGELEKEEHEELANEILKYKFEKIILMGPRVIKYTYPKMVKLVPSKGATETFLGPKEVLNFLNSNLKGGEIILFKGARFLEGVIENLLKDKKDIKTLARRERVWEIRRKKWGL